MLDYKLVEAFAIVIIEGGFEKASHKLHLTQSAVSQRVRLLEEQYGQILLKRSSPPEPTEYGLPLLVHYRKVQQLETDLLTHRPNNQRTPFSSLSIAVNSDSLSTWFYETVKDILEKDKIVLDLHLDDQDNTHEHMQSGKVWGCISTRKRPFQGCKVTHLGRMRYGIFATHLFSSKWFPVGLTLQTAENAPMARYNRKDDLNRRMFKTIFNDTPQSPPTFFLPSTEMYGHFVTEGHCYGILPEQQSREHEATGKIMNLSPHHWISVELYWHTWTMKSETMENFNNFFIRNAQKLLM